MASEGDPGPPPPSNLTNFLKLVAAQGKKPLSVAQHKFVKKITEIPTVALSVEQPCKTALNLSERGLIGKFTGLWPSPKTAETWVHKDIQKIEAVKDIQKIDMPDILMLQETKLDENVTLTIGKEKWKKNAGMAVSARGASSGLATLWSSDKFQLRKSFATQHWIFTELNHT